MTSPFKSNIFTTNPRRRRQPRNFSLSYLICSRSWIKGARSGMDNGFRLLLDAETFDYGLGLPGGGLGSGEGFVVAVANHGDYPAFLTQGNLVAAGTVTHLAVEATVVTTTEAARRRVTADERMCYAEDEVVFPHLTHPSLRLGCIATCFYLTCTIFEQNELFIC